MVDTSWQNLSVFRYAVSETGWSFGRDIGMWYFQKLTARGIMLKLDDGFETAVESFRPRVRATTPDIVKWVGDIVG